MYAVVGWTGKGKRATGGFSFANAMTCLHKETLICFFASTLRSRLNFTFSIMATSR